MIANIQIQILFLWQQWRFKITAKLHFFFSINLGNEFGYSRILYHQTFSILMNSTSGVLYVHLPPNLGLKMTISSNDHIPKAQTAGKSPIYTK